MIFVVPVLGLFGILWLIVWWTQSRRKAEHIVQTAAYFQEQYELHQADEERATIHGQQFPGYPYDDRRRGYDNYGISLW